MRTREIDEEEEKEAEKNRRKDKLALGQKNYNHLGYNTRKHYKNNYYRAKYDKAQI